MRVEIYFRSYLSVTNSLRSDVPMFNVSFGQAVMQRDSFVEWRAIVAEMRTRRRVEGYGRSVDDLSLFIFVRVRTVLRYSDSFCDTVRKSVISNFLQAITEHIIKSIMSSWRIDWHT